MNMYSRVIVDRTTGKNVDEYLETVFRQLFEWNVEGEQGPAIEQILEEYTTSIFAEDAVSSKGIISDPAAAVVWASQFGELDVSAVNASLVQQLRAFDKVFNVEINYSAKIGPAKAGQRRSYGRTIHQVTLLAGVQVLRETANQILNKKDNQQHH